MAEREPGRRGAQRGGDVRFPAEPEEPQGAGVAAFDQGAAGVACDPPPVRGCEVPGGELAQDEFRMVLGDVVEVVGDRAADEERDILFQGVEDAGGRRWIADEGGEAQSPGEPWAAAFAGEAPDFLVRVAGPAEHGGESALKVSHEKGTHGKFRRAEDREASQRFQGKVEVIEAESGDEVG